MFIISDEEEYKEYRHLIQPGDVIAFGGRGFYSWFIKWKTKSKVSHVGIVMQTSLFSGGVKSMDIDSILHVGESTTLYKGKPGVSINTLSERARMYKGEVWWLPLNDHAREKFNSLAASRFLRGEEHKPYDMEQAIKSAIDYFEDVPIYGNLVKNKEDDGAWFCSELVTKALKVGGIVDMGICSAEQTPQDVVEFGIYKEEL